MQTWAVGCSLSIDVSKVVAGSAPNARARMNSIIRSMCKGRLRLPAVAAWCCCAGGEGAGFLSSEGLLVALGWFLC